MALFSTLLSSSATQLKDGSSSTSDDGGPGRTTPSVPATLSSTSIPTVVQLYTSKALNMMPGIHDSNDDLLSETGMNNNKNMDKSGSAGNLQKLDVTAEDEGGLLLDGKNGTNNGHGLSSYEVLSYQAIQVSATPPTLSSSSSSSSSHKSSTAETLLFGSKRKFSTPFHKQLQVLEPNLGVWNCRCPSYNDVNNNATSSSPPNKNNKTLVVDQLLKVPLEELDTGTSGEDRRPPGFMLTVDLSDPLEVEPTISTLQQVLVRHLIESSEIYMTKSSSAAATSLENSDPTTTTTTTTTSAATTTSLEQLRQVQFGLASHDLGTIKETTTQESDALVKISLVVCAIVPPSFTIQDYKSKQAQSLLFYHLRKYCASLQASLCLCRTHKLSSSTNNLDSPKSNKTTTTTTGPNKKKKKNRQHKKNAHDTTTTTAEEDAKEQEANSSLTPTEMSYALRQIVLGKEMENSTKMKLSTSSTTTTTAEEEEDTTATHKEEKDGNDDGAEENTNTNNDNGEEDEGGDEDLDEDMGISAIYRPGPSMQEDLIETVCLRNAHCSGEWDASTDSIWLALPSFEDGENSSKSRKESLLDKMKQSRGDDEWLFQLRDSVSALMSTSSSSSTSLSEKTTTNNTNTFTSTKSTNSSKVPPSAAAASSGGGGGGVTLEDFMNSSTPAPSTKSKSSSSSTKASKKNASKKSASSAKKKATPAADGPDVSSFFEDLLKK